MSVEPEVRTAGRRGPAPPLTAPRGVVASAVRTSRRPAAAQLEGRAGELEGIRGFLGAAATCGAALLVSGDAGAGESARLDAAAGLAAADGTSVLRAEGVEFEVDPASSA